MRIFPLLSLLIVAVLVSGCVQEQPQQNITSPEEGLPQFIQEPETPFEYYTVEEISKHNSTADCWLLIDEDVFDVTEWIPLHPGGAVIILQNCGKDATELFETRPMGSGTPHSENAETILGEYYIGELEE